MTENSRRSSLTTARIEPNRDGKSKAVLTRNGEEVNVIPGESSIDLVVELVARGFKSQRVGSDEVFILKTSQAPCGYGVATTMDRRTSVRQFEDPNRGTINVILGTSRDRYCYQLRYPDGRSLLPRWPILVNAVGGFPSEEKAVQHAREALPDFR